MRSLVPLSLLALVVLAGCARLPEDRPSDLPLAGTRWLLDGLTLPDGDERGGEGATLEFGVDGRVSVQSCNVCNGIWSTTGDTLRLGPLGCTRRACPGQLEVERYLSGGSFAVTQTENALTVRGQEAGEDPVALRFRRTTREIGG